MSPKVIKSITNGIGINIMLADRQKMSGNVILEAGPTIKRSEHLVGLPSYQVTVLLYLCNTDSRTSNSRINAKGFSR